MVRNHSDDGEDFGRMQSQNALRNKSNTKFLSDVERLNDEDYEEAIETIERQRKMIDAANHGYLNSLDMSTHEKALEKLRVRTYDSDEDETGIFRASKDLLQTNRDATSAISNARKGFDSYASYEEARSKDQERVKDVVVAGKRVFERELSGMRRDSKVPNENTEVDAQAQAIFVGQRQQSKDGNVADQLKYLQKGVKKMTKGLSYDM